MLISFYHQGGYLLLSVRSPVWDLLRVVGFIALRVGYLMILLQCRMVAIVGITTMFFLLAKVLVREKMSGEFRDILIFIADDFFWIRRICTEMTYVEVTYYFLGTESSFFFTIVCVS
jgi:hypothetical protein